MPISDQGDYENGHFSKVYDQIFKPAIEDAGYEPYRVDENKICDSIIKKIFDAIINCPMALCDLSNRNPNVLYELGLRQAYDKPVVLVQDEKTERIFDVSGINTVGYNSTRLYEHVVEARENITEAIRSTREGKENSIIKVVKAGIADLPTGELTKEDKVEFMLNSIMKDVQDLKHKDQNNVFSNKDYQSFILNQKPNFKIQELNDDSCIGRLRLKNGISNKEIDKVIHSCDWLKVIDYKRVGDILEINFGLSDRIEVDAAMRYFNKRLS